MISNGRLAARLFVTRPGQQRLPPAGKACPVPHQYTANGGL